MTRIRYLEGKCFISIWTLGRIQALWFCLSFLVSRWLKRDKIPWRFNRTFPFPFCTAVSSGTDLEHETNQDSMPRKKILTQSPETWLLPGFCSVRIFWAFLRNIFKNSAKYISDDVHKAMTLWTRNLHDQPCFECFCGRFVDQEITFDGKIFLK